MTKLFNAENIGVNIPKAHVMTDHYLGFGKYGSKYIDAENHKFSIKIDDDEIYLEYDEENGVQLYATGSYNHRINCRDLIKCFQKITKLNRPKFQIKKISDGKFKLELTNETR